MPPPPSSEMRIKKIIRTKVNTAYRLQMSMQYDTEEKLLNVTVHQAVVHERLSETPVYQVRVQLLPDRPKKRRTAWSRREDPRWNETFTFAVPKQDVRLKEVELSLVDRKGIFTRAALVGRTSMRLSELTDSGVEKAWLNLTSVDTPSTEWTAIFS